MFLARTLALCPETHALQRSVLCKGAAYRLYSNRQRGGREAGSKDEPSKKRNAKTKSIEGPNGKLAMHGMELLYGASPIQAALSQCRRTVYGLYRQDQFMGDLPRTRFDDITQMAEAQDVPITPTSKRLLDSMARNNNHQGLVLKVGLMELPKLLCLGRFRQDDASYSAVLHGSTVELEPRRRFPLWVCLDRIQDERNLGSIIRSALFFGVDGILLSGKEACKPGPVASKASAGAMECANICRASQVGKVLDSSKANGWSIICATSASTTDASGAIRRATGLDGLANLSSPTLLVLGSEGDGVQRDILKRSDVNVCIPAKAEIPSYIDSLNVGVAAGVLLSAVKFRGEMS